MQQGSLIPTTIYRQTALWPTFSAPFEELSRVWTFLHGLQRPAAFSRVHLLASISTGWGLVPQIPSGVDSSLNYPYHIRLSCEGKNACDCHLFFQVSALEKSASN